MELFEALEPHHLGEGRGCRSEGEGGGQGGGVAPGEVVIVGVEEVVPPPAVAGEHLGRGRYNAEHSWGNVSTVITTVTKIAHTPLRTLAVRRSLRSYLVSKFKSNMYGFYLFIYVFYVYPFCVCTWEQFEEDI